MSPNKQQTNKYVLFYRLPNSYYKHSQVVLPSQEQFKQIHINVTKVLGQWIASTLPWHIYRLRAAHRSRILSAHYCYLKETTSMVERLLYGNIPVCLWSTDFEFGTCYRGVNGESDPNLARMNANWWRLLNPQTTIEVIIKLSLSPKRNLGLNDRFWFSSL